MVLSERHDVAEFYDYLTLHIVPGPRSLSYFIPILLIVATLLVPPSALSHQQIRRFVLPLIYVIQLYVWLWHGSFDVISVDVALIAFMLLGWHDVRRDFRYVQRLRVRRPPPSASEITLQAGGHVPGKNEVDRDEPPLSASNQPPSFALKPYPASFLSRVKWVGILFSSRRLTDWHIGVPSHDSQQPSPIRSFSDFALETVTQAMFACVLLDLTSLYMRTMVCQHHTPILTREAVLDRITGSLVLLAHFYAALSLLLACVPQLISISVLILAPSLRSNSMISPLTWPGYFGPLSSVYSRSQTLPSRKTGLRAFWGIFWHQNMRYMTSTPGVALAWLLGLERGSQMRYMVIVANGFFWSGVVHMGTVPSQPIGTILGPWQMRLRVASFFWLQIVGVGIEELVHSASSVKHTGKFRGGNKEGFMKEQHKNNKDTENFEGGIVGFCAMCARVMWTVSFLAITAWWTVLPVGCEMGWWNMEFLPVSYFGHSSA